MNSVIHRDYQISSSVQIAMYDNRFEIPSLDSIYGFITLEEALRGYYSIRNKNTTRILEKVEVLVA